MNAPAFKRDPWNLSSNLYPATGKQMSQQQM